MPIAHEFDYVRPDTLTEAVAVLAQHGPGARILVGGTDLIGWLRDELIEPSLLIDLKGIADLKNITLRDNTLSIGALTTFSDLIASKVVREKFPLIFEMAGAVGSKGIRNRATLVGNICAAVPCCDAGPVLLVYEADVWVMGPNGERKIPVADWFVGPRQSALAQGEIVTRVELLLPTGGHGGCYVKLGRYRGEDLAQASVALLALPGNSYRVAFGAVAPTPVRALQIEALLNGQPLEPALIEDGKRLIPSETAPITDIRASKEYRSLMLPIMFARGIAAAVSRRDGKGPRYGTRFV
jgi:carbon-monoxide dehydrogenase medium subunit